MFKHKTVLQCWVCDQPIKGEQRQWVRHMDGHAYAYCAACAAKISKVETNG